MQVLSSLQKKFTMAWLTKHFFFFKKYQQIHISLQRKRKTFTSFESAGERPSKRGPLKAHWMPWVWPIPTVSDTASCL